MCLKAKNSSTRPVFYVCADYDLWSNFFTLFFPHCVAVFGVFRKGGFSRSCNNQCNTWINHFRVFFSPDVVVSTEDHAAFRVAWRAYFAQLGLAAGALEAPAVPVAVHGVKEETVCDFAPAACTTLPGQRTCAHRWWLAAASGIHHCL